MSEKLSTKRVVIIDGHPDPAPKRLCGSICDAYDKAATQAGHGVTRIRIADLECQPLRSRHEWEHEDTPELLKAAQSAMLKADHWVLVYPLWLGNIPSKLGAFMEQVLRPGIDGLEHEQNANWAIDMGGKSARVIVTMAMPAALYKTWFRAHSLKSLERNVLKFIGFDPVKSTIVGNVYGKKARGMEKVFDRIAKLGRDAK